MSGAGDHSAEPAEGNTSPSTSDSHTSAGVGVFDALTGGLVTGEAAHIYGEPGTGVSAFCAEVLVNRVANTPEQAIYIGRNPPVGIAQRIAADRGMEPEAVTNDILVRSPETLAEQATAIKTATNFAADNETSLIVVDTLTGLYRSARDELSVTDEYDESSDASETASDSYAGFNERADVTESLQSQLLGLLGTLRRHDISGLITNQVAYNPDTDGDLSFTPVANYLMGYYHYSVALAGGIDEEVQTAHLVDHPEKDRHMQKYEASTAGIVPIETEDSAPP